MIDEFINHTWVTVLERFRGSNGVSIRELEGYLPPDAMAWCKADATERLVVEWNTSGPTLRMMKASPESNRRLCSQTSPDTRRAGVQRSITGPGDSLCRQTLCCRGIPIPPQSPAPFFLWQGRNSTGAFSCVRCRDRRCGNTTTQSG